MKVPPPGNVINALQVPVQQEMPPGGDRGMVRLAVMDGKTIGHRVSTYQSMVTRFQLSTTHIWERFAPLQTVQGL